MRWIVGVFRQTHNFGVSAGNVQMRQYAGISSSSSSSSILVRPRVIACHIQSINSVRGEIDGNNWMVVVVVVVRSRSKRRRIVVLVLGDERTVNGIVGCLLQDLGVSATFAKGFSWIVGAIVCHDEAIGCQVQRCECILQQVAQRRNGLKQVPKQIMVGSMMKEFHVGWRSQCLGEGVKG